MIELNEIPNDVEQESDYVGGGGFILDTDIYDLTVDMMYYGESAGGAAFLDCKFLVNGDPNKTYKERVYFSTGKAKGQVTYYEKNGKKFNLPGYTTLFNIIAVTCNQPLNAVLPTAEKKMVEIYDFDAKAEVATEVLVVTAAIGKSFKAAIKRILEMKQVKNDDGDYVDSQSETREKNELSSIFFTDMMTVVEKTAKAEAPIHHDKWLKKWKDEVVDKTKGKVNSTAGQSNPGPAAGTQTAQASMFD